MYNNAGLLWLAREASRAGLRLFMVGGSVRDHILGRTCVDIDLVCTQDPTPLAKTLARTFKGHWFSLDATRNYSRVTLPPPNACQFDFSPLRAPDLKGDLALRDFTINAMAIDLAQLPNSEDANIQTTVPCPDLRIFDPLHGQEDLKRQCLHLCSPMVLHDDPLRILKGLRHCATFGFRFSPATRSACAAAAQGLAEIAPERIRSEIAGIFSATHLTHLRYALTELHTCGAAAVLNLAPPPSEPPEQYISPALERAFTLLELCDKECSYIATRMQWSAGDEFTYRSLGLFATWLRASTAPDQSVSATEPHLKLSRKAQMWLKWFLTCPEDILVQLEHLNSQRYPRRALQHLAYAGAPLPQGLAALVFFCRHGMDHSRDNSADIHTLLPATLIQQRFPLIQGKDLGSCLESMNAAERLGNISNSTEAWEWLEGYAHKQNLAPTES
ncbi:MAG: hypothetical protein LC645_05090 [Geobacteraceae bacterium]|nr:hypothetical protein [Geobacteraceae bacterium]